MPSNVPNYTIMPSAIYLLGMRLCIIRTLMNIIRVLVNIKIGYYLLLAQFLFGVHNFDQRFIPQWSRYVKLKF